MASMHVDARTCIIVPHTSARAGGMLATLSGTRCGGDGRTARGVGGPRRLVRRGGNRAACRPRAARHRVRANDIHMKWAEGDA